MSYPLRKVVEYGTLNMKHCKVEAYLLEFKLCVHPHLNDIKKREFSRADSVGEWVEPHCHYVTVYVTTPPHSGP